MKTALLAIALLLFSRWTAAQLNESDTANLQLQWHSGGSYQIGNVALLRVVNQLDLSFKVARQLVFKSQNNHLYQEIFENKADNDLNSRNYLYLNPQQKFYPYAIGFISSNFRRDIDLRYFTGLGVTYQTMQKQQHVVKISTNVIYEETDYAISTFNYSEFNGNEIVKAVWSTLYVNGFHHFDEGAVRWFYEIYFQQSLEDKVNYRFQLLNGVEVKTIKSLFIQTRILYLKENLVALPNKQEDLLWTWGLSLKIKSKQKIRLQKPLRLL